MSAVWMVAAFTGIDPHGFWLLFGYTIFSTVSQFPLGYASRRSERHMLKLMRLLVALAEAQEEQLDRIEEDLSE